MRLIITPVANRPECRLALDAAFGLAAAYRGDVAGCRITAATQLVGGVTEHMLFKTDLSVLMLHR